MSKPKPITITAGQTYFVHRYKFRHDKRRRKSRRLLKEGKVTQASSNATGWYYTALQEITII